MSNNIIPDPEEFEWDDGNSTKNWQKHGVMREEAEQAFFNFPNFIFETKAGKFKGKRYLLLGKTNNNRYLVVVFLVKGKKIRAISFRDQNKKEFEIYMKKSKDI